MKEGCATKEKYLQDQNFGLALNNLLPSVKPMLDGANESCRSKLLEGKYLPTLDYRQRRRIEWRQINSCDTYCGVIDKVMD